MKRLVSVTLALLLLLISVRTLAADFSFLDNMSLTDMLSLQTELESRINKTKAAVSASDPTNTGIWQVKYYVDEFNQPTDIGYVTTSNYVIGTFSNSATTNSTLNVGWLIDKEDIAIKLLEYGSKVVKSSFDTTDYDIIMLDPDGKKINMTGTMFKGGDRIYINSNFKPLVISALCRNSSVSFKITEKGKYASSSYLFKMEDTSFFRNAYLLLK